MAGASAIFRDVSDMINDRIWNSSAGGAFGSSRTRAHATPRVACGTRFAVLAYATGSWCMNRGLRKTGATRWGRLTRMLSRRLRFRLVLSPRKRRNRYRCQKENRLPYNVAATGTQIHHSLRNPQTSRPIERLRTVPSGATDTRSLTFLSSSSSGWTGIAPRTIAVAPVSFSQAARIGLALHR